LFIPSLVRIRWLSPRIHESKAIDNILLVSTSDQTHHLYFMTGSSFIENKTNFRAVNTSFATEFKEGEVTQEIARFPESNGDFVLSFSLADLSPFLKACKLLIISKTSFFFFLPFLTFFLFFFS
jgi:hypothetical protein